MTIPNDRGLALVGDPDGRDVGRAQFAVRQRFAHDCLRTAPDFLGVVLHPARLRIDLLVLLLGGGNDSPVPVEHDEAGARGALVNCPDVTRHNDSEYIRADPGP